MEERYLAVDASGTILLSNNKPYRVSFGTLKQWDTDGDFIEVVPCTTYDWLIKSDILDKLSWANDPVKIRIKPCEFELVED